MSEANDGCRPKKGHLARLAEAIECELWEQDTTAAKGEGVFEGDGFRLAIKGMTSSAFDVAKTLVEKAQWLSAENRTRPVGIGLRQANVLCRMKHEERLKFIAEGLPLILESAWGLWSASQQLKDVPRAADVLEGHAEEEAAKILILFDIVRCPPKLVGSRIGAMTKWFYDHLARLIYVKAVSWSAPSLKDLRGYVYSSRKAHYVEGDFGEYIMPNDELYGRESQMYVDIEAQEDDHIAWSVPRNHRGPRFFDQTPILRLVEAMSALGMFSSEGLRATSEIWGKTDFTDARTGTESDVLIWKLLKRFDREKLFTEAAEDKHVRTLRGSWQLPMYHLDFSMIGVPLEALERERERLLYNEIGDYPY